MPLSLYLHELRGVPYPQPCHDCSFSHLLSAVGMPSTTSFETMFPFLSRSQVPAEQINTLDSLSSTAAAIYPFPFPTLARFARASKRGRRQI